MLQGMNPLVQQIYHTNTCMYIIPESSLLENKYQVSAELPRCARNIKKVMESFSIPNVLFKI